MINKWILKHLSGDTVTTLMPVFILCLVAGSVFWDIEWLFWTGVCGVIISALLRLYTLFLERGGEK